MDFNATVEPITTAIAEAKKAGDKAAHKALKATMDALRKHLQRVWPGKTTEVKQRLFGLRGARLAHMRLEKAALLEDLRAFAREQAALETWTGEPPDPPLFAHLLNQGDADGLFLPIRFKHPMLVEIPGRGYPLPVGSSVNLREELSTLNRKIRIEATFRLPKLPPFLDARESDLEAMARKFDLSGTFWLKFGFLLLRTLNEIALANKQPILLSYA